MNSYFDNWNNLGNWRASMSYVTGSHSFKVGYQGSYAIYDQQTVTNDSLLAYRFQNHIAEPVHLPAPDVAGVRSHVHRLNLRAGHLDARPPDAAGRLALRPGVELQPGGRQRHHRHVAVQCAPITFPRTAGVSPYNDLTPRFGAAYDLFGNGKTALKFNLGHYLAPATNDSRYTLNNPAATNKIVTTVAAQLVRHQRQLRRRLRHPEPGGTDARRIRAARSRGTR